jgi:hypothetical protein
MMGGRNGDVSCASFSPQLWSLLFALELQELNPARLKNPLWSLTARAVSTFRLIGRA